MSKCITFYNDESLLLNEEFIHQINQYMLILLITRTEEVKEFNENPDDYNTLNLGGETYYDTIKSVAIKLFRTIQQFIFGKEKLAHFFNEIHEFWYDFINGCLKSPESVQILIDNDEILWKYTVSQVLGAWIYIITLSNDLKAKEIITRNLENLLVIYNDCDNWIKYLFIRLFTERLHYFIDYEQHISHILSAAYSNLENNILQLKNVSIDFITKMLLKSSKIFEIHNEEFHNFFKTIIGQIITSHRYYMSFK